MRAQTGLELDSLLRSSSGYQKTTPNRRGAGGREFKSPRSDQLFQWVCISIGFDLDLDLLFCRQSVFGPDLISEGDDV